MIRRKAISEFLAGAKSFSPHTCRNLTAEHNQLEFFNVGGSGSAERSAGDGSATEITVGSGLLQVLMRYSNNIRKHTFQSSIFDGFRDNFCEPAFCFALCCTRIPDPGVNICCQSGGFIASGEA